MKPHTAFLIVAFTMDSFLSEYDDEGPSGSDIADDIRGNAAYFKKVRFSITGDRYPHPQVKPFLDSSGQPTDNGNLSRRPNPAWFHQRVDLAVQTAGAHDLIADLILCGPDTQDSRSVLQASGNGGDPAPLSVHASARDWHIELNTTPAWNDHVIIRKKLKKLPEAADWIARNSVLGGHIPVIDDELAYEGAGDGWSEADVIEAHLGAFLSGGYGTTGYKPANKKGHYSWGNFKASEHPAADNLGWLRKIIDENITFWRMAPVKDSNGGNSGLGIFRRVPPGSRAMAWPGQEYVLGTDRGYGSVQIDLPAGRWHVAVYDALRMQKTILSEGASGRFSFETPESRAALFHFRKRND